VWDVERGLGADVLATRACPHQAAIPALGPSLVGDRQFRRRAATHGLLCRNSLPSLVEDLQRQRQALAPALAREGRRIDAQHGLLSRGHIADLNHDGRLNAHLARLRKQRLGLA